ncbi:MAG: hypothetical protein ABFE01_09215 [Phycisphaerales bacterium]
MDSQETDTLLQRVLSGGPPAERFRVRAMMDSASAFVQFRRVRARWRIAAMTAAAVVVIGGSFFLGRCSVTLPSVPPMTGPVATGPGRSVTVSRDVIAWLEAARLFRQLGMEDRVARAVDLANQLLPRDAASVDGPTALVPAGGVDEEPSVENANRILAQLLGE